MTVSRADRYVPAPPRTLSRELLMIQTEAFIALLEATLSSLDNQKLRHCNNSRLQTLIAEYLPLSGVFRAIYRRNYRFTDVLFNRESTSLQVLLIIHHFARN